MTVEYLDLADYIAIAVTVTGLDTQTVMNVTNQDLADSALHAPAAGFGDTTRSPAVATRSRNAARSLSVSRSVIAMG